MDTRIDEALIILKKFWKYPEFRELQKEIIDSVLQGNDTLALLPTGGGKSLCYQVPALCLEGICLVISPLIALMQDQVSRLKSMDIEAACIHSGMYYKEIENVISNARYGTLKILYLSPERLNSKSFQAILSELKYSFIAVDEAHCIAQWGNDFRPSYLKIATLREFTDKPILALTATATPYAKQEIITHLKLTDVNVFEMSFKRKQLSFFVKEDEQKKDSLLHLLTKEKESVIIYSRNRRMTVELAEFLTAHHHLSKAYHAGLSYADRMQRQEDWITDKTRVMVATNAFGMGIDKADVRMVVHLDLPQSLEEYYQEAGRAGRDQKRAHAVLLYNTQDVNRLIRQWEDQFPEIEEIKNSYKCLAIYFDLATEAVMEQSKDFDLVEFTRQFKIPIEKTLNCLKILEQSGYIQMSDAVLIPSRVMIHATVKELTTYRQKSTLLNDLILALLRTYEGIFNTDVFIQEHILAKICQIDSGSIIRSLQFLHNEEVIKYTEAKNKPQILFIGPRLRSNLIEIDIKWYLKRKELLKQRLENMLGYIHTKDCRQKYITNYFGQIDNEDCGICDNCKRKSSHLKFPQTWNEKILNAMQKQDEILIRDLLKLFIAEEQENIIEAVKKMIHENIIIRDHEILSLNPKYKKK